MAMAEGIAVVSWTPIKSNNSKLNLLEKIYRRNRAMQFDA